jgi:hypothetical protein
MQSCSSQRWVWSAFSAWPATGQVQSDSFEERLYFPTGNASVATPLRLSIDIVVQPPARAQGKSGATAASLAKAMDIQKAINTSFAAEFKQVGQMATLDIGLSRTKAEMNTIAKRESVHVNG